MQDALRYFSVREVGNVFEISILTETVDSDFLEEVTGLFAMLFFQTRKHIKLDLSPISYLPQDFLVKILQLARDLRDKKRVLVLVGIPMSLHHYLQRFHLTTLFFLPEVGLFKNPPLGSTRILPPSRD